MADQTNPPRPISARQVSAIATVSLVLAVLSFFCGAFLTAIPAIICGHIAWSKIRKSGGTVRGKGIAIAGLTVGYLAIPWAALQVWFLAGMIQGERERLHDLAVQKKEIASDDNKLKVTTSGFWMKRSDLNKEAAPQAAYKSKEMYVMVISDAKSTVGNMTLEQHHQTTRDRMLQKMNKSSATAPTSHTIDGHPAWQDQVSGTQQRTNLVFLHTTVDDGNNFQQILAWTTKSRWPQENAELREVTNSFHAEK